MSLKVKNVLMINILIIFLYNVVVFIDSIVDLYTVNKET
jgi:hypothetical protein